jgi:hypothetical protein
VTGSAARFSRRAAHSPGEIAKVRTPFFDFWRPQFSAPAALFDLHDTSVKVDVVPLQAAEFTHTNASFSCDPAERAVGFLRRVDDSSNLIGNEAARLFWILLGEFQTLERIVIYQVPAFAVFHIMLSVATRFFTVFGESLQFETNC